MGEYQNVSKNERGARMVFGAAILVRALTQSILPEQFFLMILLALYLLATSLAAWDPLYALFQNLAKPFVSLAEQWSSRRRSKTV